MRPDHFVKFQSFVWILAIAASGCGGGSPRIPTPSSPTTAAPAVTVTVTSLSVTPDSVGIQHGTEFQFSASGTFPSGTRFAWQFGDNESVTTDSPTATHRYQLAGSFVVAVEALAGTSRASASRNVVVRSLVGRWRGSVSGHTRLRNISGVNVGPALTSFEMLVTSVATPVRSGNSGTVVLNGEFNDNVGCRVRSQVGSVTGLIQVLPAQGQTFQGISWSPSNLGIVLPSYLCNGDGYDLDLIGAIDGPFDTFSGSCSPRGCAAGATCSCRFAMIRQ